jgi:hypothetical protein
MNKGAMEPYERRLHNAEKHIENIMNELAEHRPVITIYSTRNVLSVFSVVVSVATMILLLLKG